MSMLNAIQSLFGGSATVPVNQPPQPGVNNPTQVAQPGVALPSTQQSSTTAPNGVVPVQPQNDPSASPPSPMDDFKDIWSNINNPDPNAAATPFAKMDLNKVHASASAVDFSKAITPEMMTKIAAGGPEALQTMLAAMNKMSQNVYANSAVATTKIVEQALAEQHKTLTGQLPGMVRKFSANENIRESDAGQILSHPAIAPIVPAVSQMFQQKFPNASSAEIAEQVTSYFNAMGQAFGPKPKPDPRISAQTAGSDFSDW